MTSVSTFNNYIIFTTRKCFSINGEKPKESKYSRYPLNRELPEKDRLQEDDTITISKLVSETMGYILTKGGLLICITLVPFSITKVFRNVTNFAAENNTLALVTTDKPRALGVFKGNHEKAFFVTKNETLLRFADKANIVVIDRQYLLLYDKSQAKLLNMKTRHIDNIPVGADMMYFEDPWLLALDGTRFTKYDIEGNELQQYNFEAAFRVIPDSRWSSFAIHYSLFLEHDAHIQYVSRRVGQEIDATYLALEYLLPTVLLQIIYDYIRGFGPDLPRDTSNVIATLTVVRPRQEDDLFAWKPRTSVTEGMYTAYVQVNKIYLERVKLAAPKQIGIVIRPESSDFEFVTEGIVVFIVPPDDQLHVRYAGNDLTQSTFHLGIKGLKRAGFYRDDDGSLHLMALTDTTTYDYIIGYSKATKAATTSKS